MKKSHFIEAWLISSNGHELKDPCKHFGRYFRT